MARPQIVDQLIQPDGAEVLFETAPAGQGVQCHVVVVQRLEPFLKRVEIKRFQVAALRRGSQHRIEGGDVAHQSVLGFQNRVQLRREHRPAAVRHEQMPLLGLLGDHDKGVMQVLNLGADTQQALGFLDEAATFPEAQIGAFGLALLLGFARLNHRVDIAFEDLRLEHVKHAAQILQHRHLTSPLLRCRRHRESAGLHGGRHLLAGGGQQFLHDIDNPLIRVDSLVFGRQGRLIPSGIVWADREFAEFAGGGELVRPLVHMPVEGASSGLTQPHVGRRVGRQCRDAREVLDGLVCRDTPTLVDAVQVAQIPGQPRAHAHQLVGQLVETACRVACAVAHRGDQLLVDGGVSLLVGDVKNHIAHAVGAHKPGEAALLLGHAWDVEHGFAVHYAPRGDGRGLGGSAAADLAIHDDGVSGCGEIGRIPHGVVHIADFEFGMRIAVERAEFGDFIGFDVVKRLRQAGKRVKNGVAAGPMAQGIDDPLAFQQNLRARIHEAADDDVPIDVEIGERLAGLPLNRGEHCGSLRGAVGVVGAVEQLVFVEVDALIMQGGHERGVEPAATREADGCVGFAAARLARHIDRIQQHRDGFSGPCCHANDHGQFGDSAEPAFRGLVLVDAFQTTPCSPEHAGVTEQGIKRRLAAGEQLGDT